MGTDGVLDIGRTANVILETGADLIGLQEVDRGLERSGWVDQPSLLARLTGLSVAFFPTLRLGQGEYGMAVAAEGELDARFEDLPRVEEEEPRGLILATWSNWSFVVTHLSRHRRARQLQIKAVAQTTALLGGPTVVLGDFNASARALGPLKDAGFIPLRPASRAGRSLLSRVRLDHILVGSGATATRCWTISSRASDHDPVIAEVSARRGT